MKLQDKIFTLRKQTGMSQEEAANRLNVSRQAFSRWENGSAQPTANNIVEISRLFGVTADYLLNHDCQSDDDIPAVTKSKKSNLILRTNLTWIAIIVQAVALNIAIQPIGEGVDPTLILWIKIIPLLAASIWMLCNLRYETNPEQRAKNSKIELIYCCVQAVIAIVAHLTQFYFLGTILLIVVCLLYILKINPKYMKRKLTK